MRVGVLGTGMVGTTIAGKLVDLGHEVRMESRTADNERVVAWARSAGAFASNGTLADAAAFGELIFNCTAGTASLDALAAAAADSLARKTLVDVQPARLLAGHAAVALRLLHGQPCRADPAGLPRRPRREGAEHDRLRGDGRSRACPRRAPRLRLRGRRGCEGAGGRAARVLRLAARLHPRPRRPHGCARHRGVPPSVAAALGRVARHAPLEHRGPPQATRT